MQTFVEIKAHMEIENADNDNGYTSSRQLLTSFIWDMLIMLRLTSKMKEIKNIHIM